MEETKTTQKLFLGYFDSIKDTRVQGRCTYPLHELLGIIVCGLLCGFEDMVGIAQFANHNQGWFRDRLGFVLKSIPTHDTLTRILIAIKPSEFEKCLKQFLQHLTREPEQPIAPHIAIDGKTMKGTKRQVAGKQKMAHIVSAWASEINLCLGQVRTSDKSNEITAIPELLEILDLKGVLVTVDAMGCQKEIVAKIVEGEGDYLIPVKGNQRNLMADAKALADEAVETNYAGLDTAQEEQIKRHGRIESHYCFVINKLEAINNGIRNLEAWPNLKAIVGITTVREVEEKTTYETRFYITSREATAKEFLHWTREHWSIENNLHWMLDMAFDEDHQRLRSGNAPENMNLIRKQLLKAFKDAPLNCGVKNRRLIANSDPEYRELVFQAFLRGF
jgi:predicted transposase YbfD/YdcC